MINTSSSDIDLRQFILTDPVVTHIYWIPTWSKKIQHKENKLRTEVHFPGSWTLVSEVKNNISLSAAVISAG